MLIRNTLFTLCSVALVAVSPAIAQSLKVGDKAPAISVDTWAKGEPVTEFSSDNYYIVEFWATWCGPCIAGMPHVSELQEQYKDEGLVVIGVNIWDDPRKVKPFMQNGSGATRGKSGGDLMQYRVAVDKVIDKNDPKHGAMAIEWMKAAGRNSIPSAFVVDYDGRIAWMGHPMQMDGIVQNLASQYATRVGSKQVTDHIARNAELDEKAAPIIEKTNEAIKAKQWTRALAGANGILKIDEQYFGEWAAKKVAILAQKSPGSRDTLVYAKQLVTSTYKDNAPVLTDVAEALLTYEPKNENARAIVTIAISQAVLKASKSDARVLAASAMAKHVDGKAEEAIDMLTEAINVLEATPPSDGADVADIKAYETLKNSWRKRLDDYKRVDIDNSEK